MWGVDVADLSFSLLWLDVARLSPALLLPARTLGPGRAYSFTCCVPTCAASLGNATLLVNTTLGPTAGAVVATYDVSAVASFPNNVPRPSATSAFTLAATGWVPPPTASSITSTMCYQVRIGAGASCGAWPPM